jgi:hypothetical protein
MTDRENQRRLDDLALKYLAALDAGDFDALAALWEQAAADADLDAMLHELNAEVAAEQEGQDQATDAALLEAIRKHLPSAEVIAPAGPVTVAEVAEHLRRNPPAGLTADELKANDLLLQAAEELPPDLGVSAVLGWGRRFGAVPEAYWRAFREAALKLRMRREADFALAARRAGPKPPGGKP